MTEPRERLYLEHIVECIDRIRSYTTDGREAFLADMRTQDAVIRNLQVLAESARLLPDRVTEAHPDVPWRSIVGLRNVLVHQYLSVNLERVWQVVAQDLAPLRERVAAIIDSLDE